jgi:rhamnosyltransferase
MFNGLCSGNHVVNNKHGSIVSVVVTYNPEQERFKALLASALPQVARVVIVDNGSKPEVLEWIRQLILPERLELIELGLNVGIAAAQNVGIRRVRDLGAAYVLLFDHDSIPDERMVKMLMDVVLEKDSQGIKVAAVGPRYFDERQNNPPPFIEIKGLRVIRHACAPGQHDVPVSYVIASGSLIPLKTLDAVGDMREDLFIDYVDIEWGLRAATMGYQTFGVCNALMQHDLGDEPLTFMRRSIPLHSPLRHYYLFRNAILLYQQKNLPLKWKLGDAGRLLLKFGFYALYSEPRLAHIRMMSLGVFHGVCGRAGPLR